MYLKIFILKDFQTTWPTVENFNASIKCTVFDNLIVWHLVCEDGAYSLYSYCV
jgi:hypothetical protein